MVVCLLWLLTISFQCLQASVDSSENYPDHVVIVSPSVIDREDYLCRVAMEKYYKRREVIHADIIHPYLKRIIKEETDIPSNNSGVLSRLESGDVLDNSEMDMNVIHSMIDRAITQAFDDRHNELRRITVKSEKRMSKFETGAISLLLSSVSSIVVGFIVNAMSCK